MCTGPRRRQDLPVLDGFAAESEGGDGNNRVAFVLESCIILS